MAENPIKASDLFEDDGIIRELIKQLQAMEKHMAELAKTIVESAKKIQAETKRTNVAQDEGRKKLAELEAEAQKLTKAQAALVQAQRRIADETTKAKAALALHAKEAKAAATAEYARTKAGKETLLQTMRAKTELAELSRLTKEQAAAERIRSEAGKQAAMETAKLSAETRIQRQELAASARESISAEGSYNQLSAQYAQMKIALNAMSHEQRHNTEAGRQMERQAREVYNRMNELQIATGKHQLQVGNYAGGIREATMSLKEMQDTLTRLKNISLEGKTEQEIRDIETATGELTDRMRKYNMEMQAHGMDTFEMISGAAGGAIAAVQGLAGAFNVLGIENETLRKVQQNMVSMIAITQALDRLEKLYHQRTYQTLILRTKVMAVQAKEAVVKKYHAAVTWLQVRAQQAQVRATVGSTAATGAAATATTAATAATGAWTIAVKAFSAAVYNIPVLGWLLAILGAIIAAVVALIKHWEKVTSLFRRFGRALGIVKRDTEDLVDVQERAARTMERLEAQYRSAERVIRRVTQVRQREIDILKALGASVEQVEQKERDLLTAQLEAAKSQALIAMRMGDTARMNELADLIGEIEHQLQLHDINSANRAAERRKQEAKDFADRQKEVLQHVRRQEVAALRLAVLEAKTAEERLKAREALAKKLADIDMADMGEQERLLRQKELDEELLYTREEYWNAIIEEEEKQFELLADITNSAYDKAKAALQGELQTRREIAKDDYELNLALDKWYEEQKTELEREWEQKRIDEQIKALGERLALEEAQFNVERRTAEEQNKFKLEQDIKFYEARLELMRKFAPDSVEVQFLEAEVARARRELKEATEGTPGDFWEAIGIKISDEGKDLIAESTQFALAQVGMMIQARMQEAEAARQAAQQITNDKRAAYQEELKLAQEGHANRLELAEQEMKEAERREAEAEKHAKRQRQKAARLEGLAQAGNLLVASTKIMAQYGIPAAIPFLALMWGTFYAQRRQAARAARETYGEGHFETVDSGGSHASGRDTKFPIDRRVERGESWAVFRKTATQKYGAKALEKMVEDINALRFEENLSQFVTLSPESRTVDMSGVENRLGTLIDQNRTRTYINEKGQLVEVRGNTKRIYV